MSPSRQEKEIEIITYHRMFDVKDGQHWIYEQFWDELRIGDLE